MEQSARLPDDGAVTGWSTLRLRGGGFFDGLEPDGCTEIPVPLALGPRGNIRPSAAVSLSWEPLERHEVVRVYGVPCTTVPRGLFDEMRRTGELRPAVVAMDMAAAAALTSIRRMSAYTDDHGGWMNVPLVRSALPLSSELSRSPNETRMRLIWVLDAGLPAPLVNQPVWDLGGRLLGIADLLEPVAGLVGEFDGADHRGARRHSKDVDREARFRDVRLEVFRVTGPDLADPPLVVRRMRGARDRATWAPPAERAWTIDPPRG